MYRIRGYLNIDSRKQIYLSLTHSHVLYCCAIWGGTYETFINSLLVEQKNLIRVMLNCTRFEHTNSYFSSQKLLKLPDVIHLQSYLFVYGAFHTSPAHENYFISLNQDESRYNNLRIPLYTTNHAKQSIQFRGSKSWNTLPETIKMSASRPIFKGNLIDILLDG